MKYDPNAPLPDLNEYTLITNKGGKKHWRKRLGRGGKGATLNTACREQSNLMGAASPATARLRRALNPYEGRMDFGRFGARVSARIRKSLTDGTWPDYGILRDYHFQKEHPFDPILRAGRTVKKEEGQVIVRIQIPEGGAVVGKSNNLTRYRFSLLLVAGDPVEAEVPLTTGLVESADYAYGKAAEDCLLTIAVPVDGRPWMVCLRLESYEGKELACANKYCGMKVVAWG